ncbi:MAG: hypothetical protein ABR562_08825 [Thermoplasmatota archaeon]
MDNPPKTPKTPNFELIRKPTQSSGAAIKSIAPRKGRLEFVPSAFSADKIPWPKRLVSGGLGEQ